MTASFQPQDLIKHATTEKKGHLKLTQNEAKPIAPAMKKAVPGPTKTSFSSTQKTKGVQSNQAQAKAEKAGQDKVVRRNTAQNQHDQLLQKNDQQIKLSDKKEEEKLPIFEHLPPLVGEVRFRKRRSLSSDNAIQPEQPSTSMADQSNHSVERELATLSGVHRHWTWSKLRPPIGYRRLEVPGISEQGIQFRLQHMLEREDGNHRPARSAARPNWPNIILPDFQKEREEKENIDKQANYKHKSFHEILRRRREEAIRDRKSTRLNSSHR